MNTIVYVGMDVHEESYTLCCYCYDTDKVEYKQTIPSDYKLVLKYWNQFVADMKEKSLLFVGMKQDVSDTHCITSLENMRLTVRSLHQLQWLSQIQAI